MIGQTISHYRITGQLGSGGMGVVYKAEDTNLDRTVALKLLAAHLLESEEHKQRFLREAKAAASLDHPNICVIYEVGELEGRGFLAMGYIDGPELRDKIKERPLKLDEALDIAIQAAAGLRAAHQKGVIHRDIKSSNLMLTSTGQVKIMDFGVAQLIGTARLTKSDTMLGTPAYMSPEQAQGRETDRRTDIWSLGVVLYEMVTGRLPFTGEREASVVHSIIHERHEPVTAVRAGVPLELDRIVGKALAKTPEERYQHLDDMLVDLRALRAGVANVRPASRRATVGHRRWLWGAAATVLLALGWFALPHWWKTTERRLSDGNRPSTNHEANAYYERSLLFGGIAHADVQQMRRMLERALALDPKFAAARAEYAFSNVAMIFEGSSNDPSLLYKAEEDVRQALRDDPDCGRAHFVLAGVYLLVGRKELLRGEVDKALKANPDDVTAHSWLLLYHLFNGDETQALQLARQMITRWPLFWPARLNLGQLLRQQGDTAGAIRELEGALEQDPQNVQLLSPLAWAYIDSGDLSKARQVLERAPPERRQSYLLRQNWAVLFALEGKRGEALREMDGQVQAYAAIQIYAPLRAAEFYAVMGETAKALEWLDRAVRMGDDREDWLRRDPLLVELTGQSVWTSALRVSALESNGLAD